MGLRLLPLCSLCSAPHESALSRTALHHQHCASKAHALLVELQGSFVWFLKWSVRLDSHQHPPGYEPDALLLSYRPMG